MMRSLVTLWFTLATLIGPGLCCCSLRILSAETPTAPATESCCPCCQHDSTPAQSDESAPSRCSCRDHRTTEAVRISEPSPDPLLASLDPHLAEFAVQSVPATVAPREAVAVLPFHSTTELLWVFHFLRC